MQSPRKVLPGTGMISLAASCRAQALLGPWLAIAFDELRWYLMNSGPGVGCWHFSLAGEGTRKWQRALCPVPWKNQDTQGLGDLSASCNSLYL